MSFWQDLLSSYADGSAEEPLANQKLGLGTLDEWRPGFASKRWPVDTDLFHGRALFGGYIAALADQMLGLAAMTVLDDGHFFGTTNMTINYLAPVTGGELLIEAHVVSQRKRSILVECSFYVDKDLVAKASATQVLYTTS
jgi:uncharacterized protein (TIGR00369 family)